MRKLIGGAAVLAALVAPTVANAAAQSFTVDGNGVFGVHAVKATGGSVDLTAITDATVWLRDARSDMHYDPALGTPVTTHGWLRFRVGDAPLSTTVTGTDFRLKVRNWHHDVGHIGARVHAWGRVFQLRIKGTYAIGDLPAQPTDRNHPPHVGHLIANDDTFVVYGRLNGRVSTPADRGSHVTFSTGRRGGSARFVDLSVGHDLAVDCPNARLNGHDGAGHPLIVCLGLRNGPPAKAAGSDFRYRVRGRVLVASFDNETQGIVEGHAHGIIDHNGNGRIDPRGYNRWFLSTPLA